MGTKTNVCAAGMRDVKAAGPVFIVNHASVMEGPQDHSESYLWRRSHETVRIDHPLDSYEGNSSVLCGNGIQCARGSVMIAGLSDCTGGLRSHHHDSPANEGRCRYRREKLRHLQSLDRAPASPRSQAACHINFVWVVVVRRARHP